MLKLNRLILVIFVLCGSATKCKAESESLLTLNELQKYALAHSSKVKEISASFSQKVADSIAVEQLQNPQLQGSAGLPMSSDEEGGPKTQLNLTLSQTIRAGDFGSRSQVSKLMRSLGSTQQNVDLQEFIAKLSLAYYSLWALQMEEQFIRDQLTWAKKIKRLLARPDAVGRVSPPQKITAGANVAKLEAALLGVEHSKSKAKAGLVRLSSYPLGEQKLIKPDNMKLPTFKTAWSELEENNNGLLKRYELRNQLRSEQLNMAKKERFSGVQPQLGYSRNEDGDEFFGVGFTVALPLFQRNEANVERERGLQREARATLSYLRSERFKEEFRLIYEGAEAKLKQAKTYESKVLPALKEALEASEKLFKNGQLSLFELWQVQSDFNDARHQSTGLWIDAFGASIEISLLNGTAIF